MNRFIRNHLDEAGRLGEVLFGLIMALGFTASARLGFEEADNRELFVAILGCNVAWAIVDGVMYVLTEVFERARKVRVARDVRASTSEQEAIEAIACELEPPLAAVSRPEHRHELYRHVLATMRSTEPADAGVQKEDLLGGAAVALLIILATIPVVAPYLLGLDPAVAVRLSNGVAIAMMFGLGVRWARITGESPLRIGLGLMALGMVLVAITIVLGG